ncbi:hypothetical protein LUZ60_007424 [Juncus effusus]|nr:hypothetical protein LUZ60_007424 [Juncus effusus]
MVLVSSPTPSPPPRRRRSRWVTPCCSSLRELDSTARQVRLSSEKLAELREAKRVVLVRHGQSTWNEEGRIQGSSDYSVLTAKGETQAETSRQMLLSDSFDVCFTSPLIRSKRTAEIIWGERKEDMLPDSDLREIDLYSFQGLLKHEGKERYGPLYRKWQKDASNFNIDDHYPVRELWARAANCWDRILAHEAKSVLVVAHNAVNQALVATALGLGTEYFRVLLQSNCGVSVLDFTPQVGSSPNICLNRLNQTPNSPVASATGAGRSAKKRIILVCQGATQNSSPNVGLLGIEYETLNMLGVVQSQKTAELLLDLKINSIIYSPRMPSVDTATAISELQEAADCLGADCVPRYVEMKQLMDLEVEPIFQNTKKNPTTSESGWLNNYNESVLTQLWTKSTTIYQTVLQELSSDSSELERNIIVVAHPAVQIGLICQALHLSADWMPSFHLDSGSVSVVDFPDGPAGKAVVRCTNYTAHLGRWSVPISRSQIDDESF